MKSILTLIFFLNLFPALADYRDQFKNCKGTNFSELHERALMLTMQAQEMVTVNGINHPVIAEALLKHFNVNVQSPKEEGLAHEVIDNLNRIAANAERTNYKCHQEKRGLWCSGKKTNAVVPPPKTVVHICPRFF